jgi:hypothetical protein
MAEGFLDQARNPIVEDGGLLAGLLKGGEGAPLPLPALVAGDGKRLASVGGCAVGFDDDTAVLDGDRILAFAHAGILSGWCQEQECPTKCLVFWWAGSLRHEFARASMMEFLNGSPWSKATQTPS